MIKKRVVAALMIMCMITMLLPITAFAEEHAGEMIWTLLETKNNYNDTNATINIDISEGNEYQFNYESDTNGKAFIDGLNIQADYNGTLFFKVTNQSFEQVTSENEAIFKIVGYGAEKRFNIVCVANHTEVTSQTFNNFSTNATLTSSSKDIKNVEYSDGAIVIGDPDDLENAYVAKGTVTVSYDQINNYDRTITKVELKYGSTQTAYSISILPCANGSAAADKTTAKQGEIVTITPNPASGYKLKSITVLDGLGQDLTQEIGLTITDNSFSMPDMNVQIKTVFEKINADGFTDELAASTGNINGSIHFNTPIPDDCTLDIRTATVSENLKQDGVLPLLLEFTVMRNNSPYPIQDNQMIIKIILPNEMLNRDIYYVSYLNNDGVLSEKQEATVDGNILTFTTSHLSGYFVEASDNAPSHTHSYPDSWSKDTTSHWHECSCGDKADMAAHTFGQWTQTKAATTTENGSKERICSVCGYKETVEITATGTTDNSVSTSQQTGDSSNMILWIALLFVSGAAFTTLGIAEKRKKYSED